MAVSEGSRGTILTFYSYKGGTGRTMALANTACLLARERAGDRPVLMMDWDFEAPGLHSFFETRLPNDGADSRARFRDRPGVLDVLVSVREAFSDPGLPPADASGDEASAYVATLDLDAAVINTGIPNLRLMMAGRLDDDDYAARVNSFDWQQFYARVPWLFPALARRLELEYAYTLIDSRTGLTDTSGICTMLMPEKLVVAFTPGRQSLTGVAGLIKRAIRYRRLSNDPRPLAVFPLPSRIESSEAELKQLWRRAPAGEKGAIGYQPLFEEILSEAYGVTPCSLESYFDEVPLQHEPRSAYGERVAVEDDKSTEVISISQSYRRFVDHLVELQSPWEDLQAVRRQRQVVLLVEKADALLLQGAEPDPIGAQAVLTEAHALVIADPPMGDAGLAAALRRVAAAHLRDDRRVGPLAIAIEVDEATLGADHIRLIAPLKQLAEAQRSIRNYDGAVQSAMRAVAIADARLGPADAKRADLWGLLADILLDKKDFPGSEQARARAVEIRGVNRTIGDSAPPVAARVPAPRAYLDWLKAECASVELLGLRIKQGQAVRLNNVYVPLTTLARADDEPSRSKARRDSALAQERQATLLIERLGEESLYVSGDPGSGKSTFCRWLAWLVCEGSAPSAEIEAPDGFRESLPASLAGRLPLLVQLRAFWHRLPEHGPVSGIDLEAVLITWLDERQSPGLSAEVMSAHFTQGTALLVLDGLDEVPAERRGLLLSALTDARQRWTEAGNRLLVTSRPYGLSADDLARLGLANAPIQTLVDELQVLLVRRWFRILLDDPARADDTADEMRRQVHSQGWLAPLMENPLLLTAMCIVFGEGRRLPEDKYELYDRVVDTVLYSRIKDRPRQQLVRARLAVVAYGMHTGEGLGEPRSSPQAEVTDDEIDQMLLSYQQGSDWSERQDRTVAEDRDELIGYTGLLLPRGEGTAAFLHLSFQEFLSAQRFTEVEADRLRDAVVERSRVPEWRNTLSFVVGSVLAASTTPERAVRLVTGLIERAEAETGTALVAADGSEIFSRLSIRLAPAAEERLRMALVRAMRGPSPARARCDAGTALGKMGDPRFRSDAWLLPDDPMLGFVEVPAGPFTMGSDKTKDTRAFDDEMPQHPVPLPAFYIAKWPVTVAQFRAFVEAPDNDGFTLEDMDCLRGVPNHPVVSVSWHEALAYSRWLTRKLREWEGTPEPLRTLLNGASTPPWSVTLPSEAEWEKAARGTDGRIYPWGPDADPNRANYDATGIGGTSAVGCFAGGASPHGVEDLSGNVWEWTRSLWGRDSSTPEFEYPYEDAARREDLTAPDGVARVVRGGAFSDLGGSVRSAIRYGFTPDGRYMDIGCRLVVSPFRS